MAADLAPTPRTGFIVQCCGDAHLSNFGALRVARAPARLRHQRLRRDAPGAVGVGRQAARREHADLRAQQRVHGCGAGGCRPRDRRRLPLADGAVRPMRNLEVWYTRFEIEKLMPQMRDAGRQRRCASASTGSSPRRAAATTCRRSRSSPQNIDGERRIVSDPPLIVRLDDFPDSEERDRLKADGERLLLEYSLTLPHERRILLKQFQLVDSARKVVGVGSVGTAAWVALLLGRDTRDPLFLQVKEAQPSVMEEFVGSTSTRTPASASSRASASCRPRATSSSAGSTSRRAFRPGARLLRPPAARLEGLGGGGGDGPDGAHRLRPALRSDACPRPRPLGRPDRDCELPGPARRLRPGRSGLQRAPTRSRTTATSARSSERSRRAA